MVGHDDISQHRVPFLIQYAEEFVDFIIGFSKLNKTKPFIAGKSDKINSRSFLFYEQPLPAN